MGSTARVLRNFQITLPRKVREHYHLKQGDLVSVNESPEGILITPVETVDRSQAWFWQKEWQEGEKKVDQEIKKGKIKSFKNAADLTRDLKK